MTIALDWARLLRRSRHAVLSTLSARLDGHPVGSVVPIAADHDGSVILLLSRLAEHTRNLSVDDRAGITVVADGSDVQAQPRLTLAGRCGRIAPDSPAAARYLRLHTAASEYLRLDFDFHRVAPAHVHYIGGFGVVKWFDGPHAAAVPPAFAPVEAELIRSLQSSLDRDRPAWRSLASSGGPAPALATMVGVDAFGCDLDLAGRRVRIEFSQPVDTADQTQVALSAALAAFDGT